MTCEKRMGLYQRELAFRERPRVEFNDPTMDQTPVHGVGHLERGAERTVRADLTGHADLPATRELPRPAHRTAPGPPAAKPNQPRALFAPASPDPRYPNVPPRNSPPAATIAYELEHGFAIQVETPRCRAT